MIDERRFRLYLCAAIHCSAAGRAAVHRALAQQIAEAGLGDAVELRDSGCQNRCEDAPNLTVWPGPVRYRRLRPADVARLVIDQLRGGEPPTGSGSSR
jgi:(2Fe-2S) ferredoxin